MSVSNRQRRSGAAVRRAAAAVVAERCEQRTLFSGPGAVLANGVLTVTGTDAADTIMVRFNLDGPAVTARVNAAAAQSFANVTRVVVDALGGNDAVSVTGPTPPGGPPPAITVVVNGGDGNDTVTTDSDQPTTVNGGNGDDSLVALGTGGAEADENERVVLNGDAGNDALVAGSPGDGDLLVTMNGGDGNDSFTRTALYDFVTVGGGAGNDTLVLGVSGGTAEGAVTVRLDGTSNGPYTVGADVENVTGTFYGSSLLVVGSAADNYLNVSSSDSSVTLMGMAGNDTLSGGSGPDDVTEYGGDGNDALYPGPGVNHFSGGAGTDTVYYSGFTADLSLYLDGSRKSGYAAFHGTDQTTGAAVTGYQDTFDGTVENAYGGSGNDVIVGTAGANALYGDGGNDTIVTLGGRDSAYGGDGNDTVYADDGGPTHVDGGAGTDTAYVDPAGDTTTHVQTVIKRQNGVVVGPSGPQKLAGTVLGTAGSYANEGNTIADAVDGNLNTFFDGPTASGAYVGLDLGSAKAVSQVRFAPRAGLAGRMVGGVIQASNSATFGGATTVYTITTAPPAGTLTTVAVSPGGVYRYWRYVGPAGGYCNVAEFEVDG